MNLYVWEGILADYTAGLAFAIANSKEEAIDVLVQNNIEKYHNPCNYNAEIMRRELSQNPPKIYNLTLLSEPIAFYVEGGS